MLTIIVTTLTIIVILLSEAFSKFEELKMHPYVISAFQTLLMQIGILSVIRWAKENPEQVLRVLRIYNEVPDSSAIWAWL